MKRPSGQDVIFGTWRWVSWIDGDGAGSGPWAGAAMAAWFFCIGEVWALAFPALAAGHVPLAGDFGCRWLAGLAAGQGGAGYRLLE